MRTNMKQWPALWSNTSTASRNGKKVFCSVAILLPSLRILQMQEAELMGLVNNHFDEGEVGATVFEDYARQNWQTNLALIDLQYRRETNDVDLKMIAFPLIDNLFHDSEHLPSLENPLRLYNYFSAFISPIAEALKYL
ncbi:hypothetical protein BGZ57DRAFT_952705 [Hyaloscypha finlandica]|nr:hypothetical protein BGZ57DRAFT_952705 [Hyaloscypha finlandica]